jgi:iron complex outermembrane receptor protein
MTTTRLTFGSSIGKRAAVVFGTALIAGMGSALAQEPAGPGTLEELVVTAQRHEQNVQDVPISVTALSGERLNSMFEGGGDIRELATRVPSLYAESSNGRLAPRFYIRGLGNTDFDLAASQPVSIIVDDVVLENVVLKSFPLFDIERVEVLRGPQGTLFGRNTPAGIVKFDTNKPVPGFDADFGVSYGELEQTTVEGAVGGGSETVSARVSFLYHERGDWISNNAPFSDADTPTGNDKMGGFEEYAYRAQLLLSPSDNLSFLFNIHGREMSNGTAAIFRANVLGPGSDGFNSNYDRDSVTFDQGENNPQEASGLGASLKIDWTFGNNMTLTSVSAWESTDDKSMGDIDGGFGADFLVPLGVPEGPCPPGHQPGQTCIPFPSKSQDGIDDLDQYTQEIRLAQQATDAVFWQGGVYYFDSKFRVTTEPFSPLFPPSTTVEHKNTAWAAFAHVSVDVTDAWNITGGVRYTDDDKDFSVINPPPARPTSVSDTNFSWDLSALYKVNDGFSVYGRVADGFRAPTIQGRDVAFGAQPSTADSETITSGEIGFKSELAGNRVRLSGAVFYYEIKDQQLTAIGGGGNFVQLVNADKGTGMGFEIEGDFRPTDNLEFTLGYSYVDTELKDDTLVVPPCGSGLCTVTDPLDANNRAIVDGNPFPQAPKYIATVTARYGVPIGNGELFFYTDWAFQGETNFFLYEAEEFQSDNTFEGGARIGYSWNQGQYELAVYGRNITDEENVKGAIDFNNLTGFDNEPRVLGVSFNAHF